MIADFLVALCFEWSPIGANELTNVTCGVTWRHELEAQKTLTAVAGHYVYQYPNSALCNLPPPKKKKKQICMIHESLIFGAEKTNIWKNHTPDITCYKTKLN